MSGYWAYCISILFSNSDGAKSAGRKTFQHRYSAGKKRLGTYMDQQALLKGCMSCYGNSLRGYSYGKGKMTQLCAIHTEKVTNNYISVLCSCSDHDHLSWLNRHLDRVGPCFPLVVPDWHLPKLHAKCFASPKDNCNLSGNCFIVENSPKLLLSTKLVSVHG